MKLSHLTELHYICNIQNLALIFRRGILCHSRAAKLQHESIADLVVQDKRSKVIVPGVGRKLHSYANLYFNARNPMMFKRKGLHEQLCVVSIAPSILKEKGVVITDRNASSQYVKFLEPPYGLAEINKDLIYARYWNHDDPIEKYLHSSIICAEVLVPDAVPPKFITAIYVSCEKTEQFVRQILIDLKVKMKIQINSDLFFQQPG